MIDLGFSGSKYTWLNMSRNNSNLKRLDRFEANNYWLQLFLNARLVTSTALSFQLTTPIVVSHKPFRLETIWTAHPQLSSVITVTPLFYKKNYIFKFGKDFYY